MLLSIMTLSIKTLSMTLSVMTLSIITLKLMTLSIMTPSIITLKIITLSIECRYAECHDYLNVILSVIVLNAVMQSVVAPFSTPLQNDKSVSAQRGSRKSNSVSLIIYTLFAM
jgi:hypothetical protein